MVLMTIAYNSEFLKKVTEPPSWEVLKRFLGGPIIKFTILAPFFGYYIIFSRQIGSYIFELDALNSCGVGFLTSVGRMYFAYFGTSLLGISVLIYSKCPDVIRDYKNRYEFIDSEMRIMERHRAVRFFKTLYKITNKNKYNEWHEYIVNYSNSISINESACDSKQIRSRILTALEDFYILSNFSKKKYRVLVFFIYWAGIICLSVPSIDLAIRILLTIFRC